MILHFKKCLKSAFQTVSDRKANWSINFLLKNSLHFKVSVFSFFLFKGWTLLAGNFGVPEEFRRDANYLETYLRFVECCFRYWNAKHSSNSRISRTESKISSLSVHIGRIYWAFYLVYFLVKMRHTKIERRRWLSSKWVQKTEEHIFNLWDSARRNWCEIVCCVSKQLLENEEKGMKLPAWNST